MAITSVSGLASGIDTAGLIEQLLFIQAAPIRQLEEKAQLLEQRKAGLQDISARLLSLKLSAFNLSKESTFDAKTVTSSNENAIIASVSGSAVAGSYTFTVGRLAQTSQAASNGFVDSDTSNVGAGTLSIEAGNGFLDRETLLSTLNGGDGVDPGSIRITDLSGASEVIDLSTAVSFQDVVNTINNASKVNVTAEASGNRLRLTSASGSGTFSVAEVGGNHTAEDLGILSSTSGTVLEGSVIHRIANNTRLAMLNDGLGIRTVAGNDITLNFRDATSAAVDLSTAQTVQDVLDLIETAGGAKIAVSISGDGQGITLRDTSGGGGVFSVTDAGNKSNALLDLGLQGVAVSDATTGREGGAGDVLIGGRLLPGLNSVLLRTLQGGVAEFDLLGNTVGDGVGVRDGTFTLTDRAGNTDVLTIASRKQVDLTVDANAGDTSVDIAAADVAGFSTGNRIRLTNGTSSDYRTITRIENIGGVTARIHFNGGLTSAYTSGASSALYLEHESLQDALDVLSDTSASNAFRSTNVQAMVSDEGNGIKLKDKTGAVSSDLIVSSTNTSNDLGIDTPGVSDDQFTGDNVNLAYLGPNTRLSDLNGGAGVFAGAMRFTDRLGVSFQVDISDAKTYVTVKDVLDRVNLLSAGAGAGIEAVINSRGDGVLIRDTSGGTGVLKVEEVSGGTTARDLNIAGSAQAASPTQIDGSFEYTISISATDTLEDVRDAINLSAAPVTATIINDGDPFSPFRLNLVSDRTGMAGKLVIATTSSGLKFAETVEAKDAAVLFGTAAGGGAPILLTDSDNTLDQAIQGLTLNLVGASANPVTVTVGRDDASIEDAVGDFVDNFNDVMDRIDALTDYNPDTGEKGVLLGDGTLRIVEDSLYDMILAKADGLSTSLTLLSQVGVRLTDTGTLTLDGGVFQDQIEKNFQAVKNLFTFSVNRALSGNGGRIFASSENAGFPAENAANDDTSDFFQDNNAGADTLTVALPGAKFISKLRVFFPSASPVSDFEIQVRRAGSSDFVTERMFSGNTTTNLLVGFGLPIEADAIRLKMNDTGFSQVAEFQVFENIGLAQRFDRILDDLTNAVDGTLVQGIDTLDAQEADISRQVDRLNDRLSASEDRLVKQFSAMERALSEMQFVSGILSSQFQSLSLG